MNESAIDVRQLEKGFGGVRAVDGLSLQVRRGESVAIFGPNGAGKTTAISILLGLLTPDAGTVSVCGVEPRRAVARGCIAAMLQKGGLMPGVKVVELVGFVRSLYADPLPLDRVLETAGLASVAGRQVDRLSGGQDPAGALRARTGGQPGGLWMPLAILPGALRTIGLALLLTYATALVLSGIHAAARFHSLAVGLLQPPVIVASQGAYLGGFVRGLSARARR